MDIRETRRVDRFVFVDRRRRCIKHSLYLIYHPKPELNWLFRSAHVGLDILVLARRARSIRPNLLRAYKSWRSDRFPQDNRTNWPVLLPQGNPPVPESVRSDTFPILIVRLMTVRGRRTVCCVLKGRSCSSRSTRSADTLRHMNSQKRLWVTFGICLADLGLQQASFRGVLDIERKDLNLRVGWAGLQSSSYTVSGLKNQTHRLNIS